MSKIRKAVIPAAGFGTRFLPATKAVPKELLPVVDKPVIQYIVEEAISAGITEILIIIAEKKLAIKNHFGDDPVLKQFLKEKGKQPELQSVDFDSNGATVHYIFQAEQKGLGHAVGLAREFIDNEDFALLLGDTIVESNTDRSVTGQLVDVYERFGDSVIAVEEVAPEDVTRYGIVKEEKIDTDISRILDLVEKPSVEEAPSRMAIASRYILSNEIFNCIDDTIPGKNDEIQLTDALKLMLSNHAIYARRISGRRHDIGNKLAFIKANVHFGLKSKDISEELASWIRQLARSLPDS
jgi:UTP--glucose-1-phosphate uridylyltransferase